MQLSNLEGGNLALRRRFQCAQVMHAKHQACIQLFEVSAVGLRTLVWFVQPYLPSPQTNEAVYIHALHHILLFHWGAQDRKFKGACLYTCMRG